MEDKTYPTVKINEDAIIRVKDSSGNSIALVEYDGYFMSVNAIEKGKIPDTRTNIPDIQRMAVRSDDIFLLAYPKAGTHWTNEIIHMLLQGKTEYHQDPKEKYMFPFQTPERIDEHPSPRIINSHMYFRHLPRDILKKRPKIVFVSRNPKDIVVSFYHHCHNASLKYNGSWNDFLEFFMSSDTVYHCPWYKYMMDWQNVIQQHPELDVLTVNYEDLKKNPRAEIEKIAVFLNVKNSTEFYSKVAESCSFEKLKQDYGRRDGHNRNIMFRKGDVGNWKEWFTVAQNEQFETYLKEKMGKSKWTFIYDI